MSDSVTNYRGLPFVPGIMISKYRGRGGNENEECLEESGSVWDCFVIGW